MKRRKFLNTTAAIAAGTVIPQVISCGSSKQPMGLNQERGASLDSKYGGVQIGAITYSFRDLKGGLESTLDACVKAGISSVELMGTGVEDYLGAPKNPVVRRSSQENPYTSEEKKMIEEYKSKIEEWRKSVGTPSLYARLRDEINKQGINVHIYKWVAGSTEEEIDYSFKVAKALGAIGISAEINESNARTLGPIAEENGMYAILHNHYQYAEPSFDVDKLLAYSPANMLNFDVGHYFGSTGLNPTDFIKKYHKRIASIHIKDKTGKNNETEQNTNQVWGQGETPLEEVLLLIKENKWPIYCDIELEYQIAPWSSSVKEVKTCRNYCRQILL